MPVAVGVLYRPDADRGAAHATGGAEPDPEDVEDVAEPGLAELDDAEPVAVEPGDAELGDAELGDAEPVAVEPGDAEPTDDADRVGPGGPSPRAAAGRATPR